MSLQINESQLPAPTTPLSFGVLSVRSDLAGQPVTSSTLTQDSAFQTFIRDRHRSREFASLGGQETEIAARAVLNICSTLQAGLEQIRNIPPGENRNNLIADLTERTRIAACSNAAIGSDAARSVCNLLTDRQFAISQQRISNQRTQVASNFTESFTSGFVGVTTGIAVGGAADALGFDMVTQGGSRAIGFGTGMFRAVNVSRGIHEIHEGVLAQGQARLEQLKEGREVSLEESQRILLQSMQQLFRQLQGDSDPEKRDLGKLAMQTLNSHDVSEYIGITSLPDNADITALLSPLDQEVIDSISGSSFSDSAAFNPVRNAFLLAKEDGIAELPVEGLTSEQKRERAESFGRTMRDISDASSIGVFVLKNIFGDDEAAATVSQVTGAALQTGALIQNLLSEAPMGPLGATAAVLNIFGSFMSSGPTPDELILQGISDLQSQINDLREEILKGFEVLAKLSGEILDKLDTALQEVHDSQHIHTVQYLDIKKRLDQLTFKLDLGRREDVDNELEASKIERRELAASTITDPTYSNRIRELASKLARIGVVKADDDALTGNGRIGGAGESLSRTLQEGNKLAFTVGYLAEIVNTTLGTAYKPANPEIWIEAASEMALMVGTSQIPDSQVATVRVDIQALRDKGIELRKLFEALNIDTLKELQIRTLTKWNVLQEALSNYALKKIEKISDDLYLAHEGIASGEQGGVFKPDLLKAAIPQGFLKYETNLISAERHIRRVGTHNSTQIIPAVYAIGLSFGDKGPFAGSPLISLASQNIKSNTEDPLRLWEARLTDTATFHFTLNPEYAAKGFSRATTVYSVGWPSPVDLMRCVEDAMHIERTAQFLDGIPSDFNNSSGSFSEFDLNNTLEGQKVMDAYNEYEDALGRFQLYATALVARQTGGISILPIDMKLANWNFLNAIFKSSVVEYLATSNDERYYMEPKQYVTGGCQVMTQTLQAIMEQTISLTEQTVTSVAQLDDVATTLLTLDQALASLG